MTSDAERSQAALTELSALANRLCTQAEAAAALVARLKLDASGEPGDARVNAQLDRVLDAIGVGALCADLDERGRSVIIGQTTAILKQALDLVERPGRAGGWSYSDAELIQSQGNASAIVATIIANMGVGKPDARILDIGTGVAALAIAFCRTFPDSTVVGLDVWEPSLALARKNIAAADLASRITLRETLIEDLEDDDGFDLVWMPVIFLAESILADAVAHAAAVMRPNADIVLGRYVGSDDPLATALGDLRAIRSGGTLLTSDDTCKLLVDAGFTDVREAERTWAAPLGMTVGRRG